MNNAAKYLKKISFILFLSAHISCFSQTTIEGFIFDKTTNSPLPYVAIILGNTNLFSITNEDGKFEINKNIQIDSIEVRHIGFESKKIPISYFIKNSKLYLIPNISQLDEIIVIADKKYLHKKLINEKAYPYKLLNDLIKKYRKKKLVSKSKAFFSLNSSDKNIPIEQIEGFYNSNQSLSEGLIDLELKSGRFGQNKSFSFYSLKNSSILKDFTFFKKTKQILPRYPGNLSSISIKNKYSLKIDECQSCGDEDISISFVPKKFNGRLFSGKIILNEKKLIIKKIELWIKDSLSMKMSPIAKNHTVTFKEIHFNINFNPIDYEKIQYLDFTLNMFYDSKFSKKFIKSHSFLYFYEYNNFFEEPYFTSIIHFNNDYDKIIASQALDDFWNLNYQYPKSYGENRALDFFKKSGYLINYENFIPTDATKNTNPSVIAWNKKNRLEWNDIKYLNNDNIISFERPRYSNSDEVLNFTYMLDFYRDGKGANQFFTRTLFDRNSSFYNKNRSKDALLYLNLIFDLYEYHRLSLAGKITENMSFEEVKRICDNKFIEASIEVKEMKFETNFGSNIEILMLWNDKVNLY